MQKLLLLIMAVVLVGCGSTSLTYVASEPPVVYRGTGKTANVQLIDGVKFYTNKTSPATKWTKFGYVVQHRHESKKDVVEFVKEKGGDVAVYVQMFTSYRGSWAIRWDIGELQKDPASSPKVTPSSKKIIKSKPASAEQLLYAESLKKDAAKGDLVAQYILGIGYEYGYTGLEKNIHESFKWYMKSANQGYAEAQYAVADAYAHGKGTKKNVAQAIRFWKQAAESGSRRAQFSLGVQYFRGSGVPEDYVTAYAWTNLAAVDHESYAGKLANQSKAIIASEMTADQIAEAQKLSRALIEGIKTKKSNSPDLTSGFTPPRIDPKTGLPMWDRE